jgi:oxalate decarboxylase
MQMTSDLPRVAGHYVENTGDTDLVVLEMFATGEFQEISLNNWIRHLPRRWSRRI